MQALSDSSVSHLVDDLYTLSLTGTRYRDTHGLSFFFEYEITLYYLVLTLRRVLELALVEPSPRAVSDARYMANQ